MSIFDVLKKKGLVKVEEKELVDETIYEVQGKDDSRGYIDSSGKFLFGGLHYELFVFRDVGGINLLGAKHEDGGHWGYYKRDGSVFGGLHSYIGGIVFGNEDLKLIPAQHLNDGLWAYYKEDGSVFGGMHHNIEGVVNAASQYLVLAQHQEKGLYGCYKEDGAFFDGFGGLHYMAEIFDICGISLVLAHHQRDSPMAYYCKDNSYYNTHVEAYFDFLISPLIKQYDLVEKYKELAFLIGFTVNKDDQNSVFKVLTESLKEVIYRHRNECFDVQKAEVERILMPIYKTLRYHPEKFLEEIGCFK